jgi:hypothetical protein
MPCAAGTVRELSHAFAAIAPNADGIYYTESKVGTALADFVATEQKSKRPGQQRVPTQAGEVAHARHSEARTHRSCHILATYTR